MAAHLFPFPPAAPAEEDASKRRRQVPAAPDAFAHCKLSAGAVMVAKRRDAWMAAGVEDGAIELLHPGKKPLEIKLCVLTSSACERDMMMLTASCQLWQTRCALVQM